MEAKKTGKWTIEQANDWYAKQPWLRGCNFIPSNAINQLEMWQAESFDPETIDRELGWVEDLGFNCMRVYLHDLAWQQDPAGFKERINRYLEIAESHGIKTIFVLFDDCWHDHPKLGEQPAPRPGVHNSGWLQGPGSKVLKDESQWDRLREYVKDILSSFGEDERVVIWDMYNEPGNNFLVSLKLPALLRNVLILGQLARHFLMPSPTKTLLYRAFAWARQVRPSQPLTAGLYFLRPFLGARLNQDCLKLSDIVSFHTYFNREHSEKIVAELQETGRPMVCTEYMARKEGSTLQEIMPLFKEHKIGAVNWGLVAGKTQTMYAWDDHYPGGEEPPLWFHDILRLDGTSYKEEEKAFLQEITRDI